MTHTQTPDDPRDQALGAAQLSSLSAATAVRCAAIALATQADPAIRARFAAELMRTIAEIDGRLWAVRTLVIAALRQSAQEHDEHGK